MKNIWIYPLFFFGVLIAGCAGQGGGYTVGPGSSSDSASSVGLEAAEKSGLSVVVPIFDPGIPDDPDDYIDEGVWPELRRAEANRFAVLLKGELEKTGAFDGVRIAPSSSTPSHLYVNGTIIKSNGEDIELKISLLDITGNKVFSKNFSRRVKDYDLNNPRLTEQDLYAPIFKEIAEYIATRANRLSDKSVTQITEIERIRYGEALSPNYFSQFIKTSRSGKTKILSVPSPNDPMVKRIDIVKVKDQMFLDGIQLDYLDFKQGMDEAYLTWQRLAFYETKAAREAKSKANVQKFVGALAIIGGIALAASGGDYYDVAPIYGGVVVAAVGIKTFSDGMQSSKRSRMHKESLDELGKSLNIELAPRVMKLENQEVELKGTLENQYATWRAFLKDFYTLEATPEIAL